MPENTEDGNGYDFVVVANRLAVNHVTYEDGTTGWERSPGGLVTALAPLMESSEGAWVGWHGAADDVLEPFDHGDMHLVPVPLTGDDIEDYYEGFSNGTLWPLYHDVIARPDFHRHWFEAYRRVNQRFAEHTAEVAAHKATVWIQDYQLQLVPAMLRDLRPDLTIGFFNHIPFPPPGLFAQLPWRHSVLRGLLGADLIGFQRASDASNFRRAVHNRLGYYVEDEMIHVPLQTNAPDHGSPLAGFNADADRGTAVRVSTAPLEGAARLVEAKEFPISIDTSTITALAQREDIIARSQEIREELGNPETVLLIGSHGAEKDLGEDAPGLELNSTESMARGKIISTLEEVAADAEGAWVEHKPAGAALHVRNVADDQLGEQILEHGRAALSLVDGAYLKNGKKVLESVVVLATKGEGITELREHTSPDAVLFAGDDVTDEHGFAVLEPEDIGIKVGAGATGAGHRIPEPKDLAEVLRRIAEQRGTSRSDARPTP